MDGVLLTGGLASRLGPITKVTNKHLLPIYNKPMVFYGIELLRDLGCKRIIIILGGNSVGDIVNLVRDGSQFGVEIVYKFQHEPRGISDAIRLTRDIIDQPESSTYYPRFLVLLGDNIFDNTENLTRSVADWILKHSDDYAIFLYESDHPHDYGQPVLGWENKPERFVEKDSSVLHNRIITGLYGLDLRAFWDIERQKASARGEYEITDTLTLNLPNITAYNYEGFWSDCGTPVGLAEATKYFMDKEKE